MTDCKEKLQQVAQTLREFSLYSEDIYWLADPTFKCSFHLNPAYERLLGRKPDELYANLKCLNNYILPKDILHSHPFLEMTQRMQHEGSQARHHIILRMIRSDGEIITMEDHGQPILDEHGQCIGVGGVAKEVTILNLSKQLLTPDSFPYTHKTKYYLKGKYKKIYLTLREAECAFYFLQAKTHKQIAKKLTLSPRTIEHVFERIKNKFALRYKSDLFNALLESDFLNSLL